MGVRSDPEFGYHSASVFIHVFDIEDDLQSEDGRKSKRTRSNRQERAERDRRRRSVGAPAGSKGDEDVTAGSHGAGKSHAVLVEELSTMQSQQWFSPRE